MENQPLSLHELLGQVKAKLKSSLPIPFWVVAEISELKVNYSGHCYIELVEKDPENEALLAKARATIWASAYRMIRPYFETTAGTTLAAGMKVMVKVSIEFHEQYGLSLNITDIEPTYTMGDMARRKQEVLNRLKADGVFDMNRSLQMADLPARIAVISSSTAAGFGDFMDQLQENGFGYKFYVKLFPAVMQGGESEQSVIAALDRVYELEDLFDAVVIIRGGGAQSDLSCFNSYGLASNICQFPLPVLTGIGHEQDETVADLVAHTRLKTPTAVAEFLIGMFREADEWINHLSQSLSDEATECVMKRKSEIDQFFHALKPLTNRYLGQLSGKLDLLGLRLAGEVRQSIKSENAYLTRITDHFHLDSRQLLISQLHRLEDLKTHVKQTVRNQLEKEKYLFTLRQNKCTYLDPFIILKRGYSITYYNGKALKSPASVPENVEIETRLDGGILKSKTI